MKLLSQLLIDCADSAEVSEYPSGANHNISALDAFFVIDFDVNQYFGFSSANFNCINAFRCSHVPLTHVHINCTNKIIN